VQLLEERFDLSERWDCEGGNGTVGLLQEFRIRTFRNSITAHPLCQFNVLPLEDKTHLQLRAFHSLLRVSFAIIPFKKLVKTFEKSNNFCDKALNDTFWGIIDNELQ
jgi:hypothetical protein